MIKLKSLLTEIRSPYEKATLSDKHRGFIGTVDSYGIVTGYTEMVPNVVEIDHSELGISHYDGGRFRFFVAHPKNSVLWNKYPPQAEEKEAVENWLAKKGYTVDRHIDYNIYSQYVD